MTTKLRIGKPEYTKTQRENEWLESHNSRRKDWHEKNGKTYVPVRWSNELTKDARIWAKTLLDETCDKKKTLYHDPKLKDGENLASNQGTGGWGKFKSTEKILKRWVEDEKDLGWDGNAHLTQALWRATKYIGCADVEKELPTGIKCHVQVCRYVKSGNCEMGTGDNWLEKLLQDDSGCGRQCPTEGCGNW